MLVDTLERDMPFLFFPLLYPVQFFFFSLSARYKSFQLYMYLSYMYLFKRNYRK